MKRLTCFLVLFSITLLLAQEQKPAAPTPISPSARLAAAKTAYVKNGGGSEIPYNVIESGIEGWGRFVIVDSPQQADIIIEIQSPEDETGMSVSSTTDDGHSSTKSSRDLTVAIIKVIVYDAKTHLMLWNAEERPKGAFKEKAREDNLVKAAEKLVSRFRDRLEPPPADKADAKTK